jgi:hypothetical protein
MEGRFRADAMDGRLITVIGFLVIPAGLIALTVAEFSSNPVAIFALISLMLLGALYLLTYRETFG